MCFRCATGARPRHSNVHRIVEPQHGLPDTLTKVESQTMAPSDTVKARFEKAVARDKAIRAVDYLGPLLQFGVLEKGGMGRAIDLADTFQIDHDSPIAKAFEISELDPSNPLHRYRLLKLLAGALFPPDKRGRKTEWTAERLSRLLSDYDQTRHKGPRSWNDIKITMAMRKQYEPYRKIKPETIRRNLARARDPKHNSDVAECAETIRAMIISEIPDLKMSVLRLEKTAIELAIQWLSKGWPREQQLTR